MYEDLVFDPPLPITFLESDEEVATARLDRIWDDSVDIGAFDKPHVRMSQFRFDLSGFSSRRAIRPGTVVSFRVILADGDFVESLEGRAALANSDEATVIGEFVQRRSTVDGAASDLIEEIERFLTRHP